MDTPQRENERLLAYYRIDPKTADKHSMVSVREARNLSSIHPETPDGYSVVFIWETSNFSLWQGNQGVARTRTSVRRTSKPAD
jgi:hypothetical protein